MNEAFPTPRTLKVSITRNGTKYTATMEPRGCDRWLVEIRESERWVGRGLWENNRIRERTAYGHTTEGAVIYKAIDKAILKKLSKTVRG
jgi:hypothetical protein